MPEYRHPGVYIEEIPSYSKSIEGVSTSITAFIGETFKNSEHEPVMVSSMSDYLSVFGPIIFEDDQVGLAVESFFLNGGEAAYICSLAKNARKGTVTLSETLKVKAKYKGKWSEKLFVRISNVKNDKFDMEVGIKYDEDSTYFDEVETYKQLSVKAGDHFAESIINPYSSHVTVEIINGVTKAPGSTSKLGVKLKNGSQTSPVLADFKEFYDSLKISDISIMILPGQIWKDGAGKDVIDVTRKYCEKTNKMLIFDISEDVELDTISKVENLSLPTSSYAALYYPWVKILNPIYHSSKNSSVNKTMCIAPSAMAAGTWAKTDSQRGVWKAPAGVEAQLMNSSGLKFQVGTKEQDYLNPLGINCIRNLANYGCVFWGARTLATKYLSEWRYISVRRTAIYIEESIYNATRWVVFEPNDQALWNSLRLSIDSFMNELFHKGALQGSTQREAYLIRCGLGDTMTQIDIDNGSVIIEIGFAPIKSAEFIILRIQQTVLVS